MATLEDRGIFWWNDERVPDRQFAPDSSVGGKLTVEDDGGVRLDLDSRLPGKKHAFEILADSGKPTSRSIQGLLNGDLGHVLLQDVIHNGGSVRTNNVSKERYLGSTCFVSKSRFRRDNRSSLKFRSLSIELAGFEEWLWLRAIEINRRRTRLVAKYKKEKDLRYKLPFGKLSIEYDLTGPYIGISKRSDLRLTESASVRLTPDDLMDVKECQTYYQRMEELLILLTSSDYNLTWPEVVSADGKQRSTLYFRRFRADATAPRVHECLINFPRIASSFGDFFASLIEKREQFGPGFYLYLGTRRGVRMFVEHRFVNLIWGLEALDRRSRGEVQANATLSARIERIANSVSDKRDLKWLRGRLRHAAEPGLAERLFAVFSPLPLPFHEKRLRKFCSDCQDRRNDISHFGGLRRAGLKYDEFMRDLDQKSGALAALYHLKLLTIIGVHKDRLDLGTNHNWALSRMEMELRAVGILKDAPKTSAPQIAGAAKEAAAARAK